MSHAHLRSLTSILHLCASQAHPLDFVTEKQGIYFRNGSILPIKGTFVTEGVQPEGVCVVGCMHRGMKEMRNESDDESVVCAGSMWSMIPIPSDCLGPRCIPGPNDTDTTPHKCLPGMRIYYNHAHIIR